MPQPLRKPIAYLLGLGATYVVTTVLGSAGCAAGGEVFVDGGGGTTGQTTATTGGGGTSQGGGGATATGGSGGEVQPGPCAMDCSSIQTPDCSVAVCNEGQYMGTFGECVVVEADDGTSCDDSQFCTTNDTCVAGVCTGGPENTCGISPAACEVITCDESSDSCTTAPGMNGSACQNANDLCTVNQTCQNGQCIGGDPVDCFFAPVPNECFVATCNPATGMCDPVPGNDGGTCVDSTDLCTVNKTCNGGMCEGGSPLDCSQLTQGCNLGVCDMATGQCVQQAVMNGDPCDDLDSCTTGEICQAGTCGGGTATTQCINADGCCPMGCTDATDDDCSCNVNLASMATPSTNGGGSGGYGPTSLNNGVNQAGCEGSGCSGCFTWISNSTSAGGAFVQYDWPSPVQIGSMFLDVNQCNVNGCSAQGRGLAAAEVQYWNGAQWVTAQTITGNSGDVAMTFNPKLNTTGLRVYNAQAASNCGQSSNTLFYEWYVWPGSGCQPPP